MLPFIKRKTLLSVLQNKLAILVLLLTCINFGCTRNLVEDKTSPGDLAGEELLAEASVGHVEMYDLGPLKASESSRYFRYRSIEKIRLVSDYEGIQGDLHLYWLKPYDKLGRELMDKHGADSGWYWYGAGTFYSAKLLEFIIPKNNEEAYIMFYTFDTGVVLKNFWNAARPSFIAQYGTQFESVLMKWLNQLAPEATPKIVPIIEEGILNSANHIFGPKKLVGHKLGGVLKAFGGDSVAALNALTEGAQKLANQGAIKGVFQAILEVAGEKVTVRGIVIDGTARISTAFIP